jgi:DNA polymerase I-like protein with 3'-5' exonuclease and polymerase domains
MYVTKGKDYEIAIGAIRKLNEFGLDTETTGLSPFMSQVLLIQVGTPWDQYVFDVYKLQAAGIDFSELKKILEDPDCIKVGHNILFDYQMLKQILGIKLENVFDTMVAEQLLTKGIKFKGFGLGAVLEKYQLTGSMDKSEQKSFIDMPFGSAFTKKQLEYAALDVKFLIPLKRKLEKLLKKYNMGELMDVENETILVIGDLQLNGVYLKKEPWQKLTKIAEEKVKAAKAELLGYLPEDFDPLPLQPKGVQTKLLKKNAVKNENQLGMDLGVKIDTTKIEIKFTSPAQVLGFLKIVTGREPEDTNEKTLYKFYRQTDGTLPPVIRVLLKYREAFKQFSTYGEKFYEDNINPFTLRIHSTYNQLKPDSGRLSSDNPNLQNIIATEEYRSCFRPQKPGYKFVCCDLSQFELRVLAELSGEESWVEVLEDDSRDLHSFVASRIYGVDEKSIVKGTSLRQVGKTLNFGLSYGAGASKLADTVNKEYMEKGIDKEMTLHEGKVAIEGFKKEFPRVWKTLEDAGNRVELLGYALSDLDNRRRYVHIDWTDPGLESHARNIGKNMICQACNASVIKRAMAGIRKRINENNYDAKIVLTVHDEVEVEVREDQAEEVAKMVEKEMIAAGKYYLKTVPVKADTHIADCWVK